MAQKKGQTGNPNGRPKGTLNKQTAELRQIISEIVFDNTVTIKTDIKKLEPEKRLILFEKLLSYVLPKPQSAEFPIEEGLVRARYGNQSWIMQETDED